MTSNRRIKIIIIMPIVYFFVTACVISLFFLSWYHFVLIFVAVGLVFYIQFYTGRPKKHYTASGKYYCLEAGEYIKVMDHNTNERLYLLHRPQEGVDVNLSQFYTQQLCNANMAYQQGLTYNGEYTAVPLNAAEIVEVSDTCAKLEKLPKT